MAKSEMSYKKECQEKDLSLGSMPPIFCLGIQPNCLNVNSYSGSGLPQAKDFPSSPHVNRRINCSSLWFHFAVVTAPFVFLKRNKPDVVHSRSGNAWSYRRLWAYGFLRLSERV
jgi:hypothetical protein